MLKQHTQSGKILAGIMIGLVLAVAIIALLMWYMNNHKTTFKPYTEEKPLPKTTEVLHPQDKTGISSEPEKTKPAADNFANDDLGQLIGRLDQAEADKTPSETTTPIIARKTPQPAKTAPNPQEILNGAAGKTASATTSAAPAKGGHTILQIGSFATRTQAESQQAKLLMLEVKTRIETAQVNGQTVYRVKANLNPAQTQTVQQRLSENHIDSLVLPNP